MKILNKMVIVVIMVLLLSGCSYSYHNMMCRVYSDENSYSNLLENTYNELEMTDIILFHLKDKPVEIHRMSLGGNSNHYEFIEDDSKFYFKNTNLKNYELDTVEIVEDMSDTFKGKTVLLKHFEPLYKFYPSVDSVSDKVVVTQVKVDEYIEEDNIFGVSFWKAEKCTYWIKNNIKAEYSTVVETKATKYLK